MEKMKQRSAWMRIMAMFLAVVMVGTMMPLDTFAAAGKDSGDYVLSDEVTADGDGDNVVDLHFTPYEFDPENFDMSNWDSDVRLYKRCGSYCLYGGSSSYQYDSARSLDSIIMVLWGEEALPEGIDPGAISVTNVQWSPGAVFNPNSAHTPDRSTSYWNNHTTEMGWENEASRLAYIRVVERWQNVIPEMEMAGLHNTDPFTVRVTQSWEGGEYTFDYVFLRGLRDYYDWYNQRGFVQGLETPPGAVSAHVDNSRFSTQSPSLSENSDGSYSLMLSFLQKKGDEQAGRSSGSDEYGDWSNGLCYFVVKNPGKENLFTGGQAYPARGIISMETLYTYFDNIKNGYSYDYSFKNDDWYKCTKTYTFQDGDNVSVLACRFTSYSSKEESTVWTNGTYYHSPAWAFNYTFGDPIPSFEDRQLTINYVLAEGATLPDGASLPEQYTETVAEGLSYRVATPEISGLQPDIKVVEGTMGASDVTVTVTYGKFLTATPPTAKTGLVYNAQTQAGVETGTGYTLTGNTAKDAGDYTAIARLEDGYTWTDGSTDGKTIEWSIAPAELTEVTLSETVFYYNGEVQRPDVVEVKAGDLIVPFEDYLVVYEGGDTKDPGTYRVYVRKEFGKNNVTGGVWATYEIKKGAVPPTAKTDLVYNGKIQIGIEEAETSWIGYKVVGYTEKDAGDYIATATLDEGYIWTDGTTDPKNIKWSIAPAPLTEIVLSETTLVYDGTVQKPAITSVLSETVPATNPATDYEIEWSDENSKDIGTYAVKAEGKGNFTGVVTAMYKISTEVTPPTAKTDLYYTGKEQTGVEPGKGYSIKDNTGTDAGSYKATATLDPGYVWTDGTTDVKEISWSIAPAELTSLGVTKTLFFYNGNVQKPEVTEVHAGSVTVPGTDYSLSWSNEQSTDVGFYTVEATATTNNFTGSATVTYEISDGIAKIPTAKTGLVYNGTMQTGVKPGTGYILWDNTGLNAGKYTATATLEEGFEWNDGSKDPKTIDWSIAPAPITGMTLSQTSFSYNGSVQKPRIKSVFAGPLQLEIGDYTLAWSDENSKEVGVYTVTVRGTYNFTGVQTRKYAIESMETWNLFEEAGEHVYTVSGITSKNEAANSNASSAKYFTAVLSKDKITVNLKEGADRKKAAAANVFDFDLGEEGAVSYTLPLTYNKPALKLSSTKGTVKKGIETPLKTTVLCQNEDGNFEPYDLSEAVVSYRRQTLDGGADGVVAIVASSKASDSIKISKEGWNEKDPIALKYTISEAAADKDVLEVDLNGVKQVILNTNNPEQSFTFPLTLNGEDASAETVEIVKGKKGEENLAQIGNGTVTVSLGRSGIGKGSYTITLKPVKESKARATIKVKVTDKAMTASGKIALKMDVVTKKPMIVIPQIKQGSGQITGAEVTGITLKKGTPKPASAFKAEVKGSYIEVSYAGSEEMTASDLEIGDMTLTLTVEDSEGNEAKVPLTLKSVTAKKTTPTVRSGKVVIPKALAEKADGTTVIGTVNIISSFKDSAKHTQTITPADVKLEPKNVDAVRDESDFSRILIKKLTGKSGTVKATLTYAGGVTKTVTIKVVKGK